jgi:lycopene cyclase domain-containing protein
VSYYFWINLLAISIPFIAGFDKRLKFYRNWKYLFPAMLGTMLVFIPWDMLKTSLEVWGFNPVHLQGIYLVNLPVEEWLFFIAIPYACLFTYHAFEYLIPKDYLGPYATGLPALSPSPADHCSDQSRPLVHLYHFCIYLHISYPAPAGFQIALPWSVLCNVFCYPDPVFYR